MAPQASVRSASEEELKAVVRRWFDLVNSGDVDRFDEIMAWDVVDHSQLNTGHGGGCDGHKALVRELRRAFPGWKSEIVDLQVQGDKVTIRHRGTGIYPPGLKSVLGASGGDPALQQASFDIVSTVRVQDGKIVEHWANQGPFGQLGGPGWPQAPGAGAPPGGATGPGGAGAGGWESGAEEGWEAGGGGVPSSPGPQTPIKRFMQRYLRDVIDAESLDRAAEYFAPNFLNHDRAPGEKPGLEGVKSFLGSIFASFAGFSTRVDEQIAEDDLVLGRWWQSFTNTGPYLGFPKSGKQVHVSGITICRVRNEHIYEVWEARDAVSLVEQLGVTLPIGPLEGGSDTGSAPPAADPDKEVVKRWFYDAWSSGNLELVDQVFAPDFVNHGLTRGQLEGRAGMRQWVRAWRGAFPDLALSVELLVGEGDRVAARWTARGTHTGTPLMGVRPSGREMEITGITVFRVSGGQIRESWGYWELFALLLQSGAVQLPPGGLTASPGQQPAWGTQPGPQQPGPQPGQQQPGGAGGGPAEEELKAVVRRWFDLLNSGQEERFDEIMAWDVVDHSQLNAGHGGGCDGHKAAVRELRRAFPEWKSEIVDLRVQGDRVTIHHRGRGVHPAALRAILGTGAADPSQQKVTFDVVSTVRVKDGKIVEHWADQGPFGQKGGPGWPSAAQAAGAPAGGWQA